MKGMIMGKSLLLLLAVLAGTFCVSLASAQEQFPIMDRVADKVIQKYQQSPCQQLAAEHNQPKSPEAQRAIQLLRDDPQMRRAFINRVATPIANKLFDCGLIP
jgi:hypothetical protein